MSERGSDLLTGFVIGGLLGLVAGILIAPKSGRETRQDLRSTAEELLRKAREEYEEALIKSKKTYQEAVDKINRLDLGEKAESLVEEIRTLPAEAREKAEGELGRVRRAWEAGVDAFKAEKP
jgi:gas vesicle protein